MLNDRGPLMMRRIVMNQEFPPAWLRHRLLEEREMAKRADTQQARMAHAKLAALFEEKLSAGSGTNDPKSVDAPAA